MYARRIVRIDSSFMLFFILEEDLKSVRYEHIYIVMYQQPLLNKNFIIF